MALSRRLPLIELYYGQCLDGESDARFIQLVSERYQPATLERLAAMGTTSVRRAALLALGGSADYESNAVFGRALQDPDRRVRMLAEQGIRAVWHRQGSKMDQRRLAAIVRRNESGSFRRAILLATRLIAERADFAEAWNQRAIAYFHLGLYAESAADCRQVLELNPYHFAAAAGLGECCLELDDAQGALDSFRRAVRLNPDLEAIRIQIRRLEQSLRDSS